MQRVIIGCKMTMHSTTPDAKLPRPVTLIGLTVLFCLFQITAAIRALQISPDIQTHLPVGLAFVASSLWAMGGLAGVGLLWRGRGRLYTAMLLLGFSIYSLLRLLLFSQADYDRGRWPFLLLLTAALLLVPVTYIALAGRTNNQS